MASAESAGVTSGSATCHQIWNSLSPSSRAAAMRQQRQLVDLAVILERGRQHVDEGQDHHDAAEEEAGPGDDPAGLEAERRGACHHRALSTRSCSKVSAIRMTNSTTVCAEA